MSLRLTIVLKIQKNPLMTQAQLILVLSQIEKFYNSRPHLLTSDGIIYSIGHLASLRLQLGPLGDQDNTNALSTRSRKCLSCPTDVIRLKDQMSAFQRNMNLTIRDLCANLAPKLLEYKPRYSSTGQLDKAQTLRINDIVADKLSLQKTSNLTLSLCKIVLLSQDNRFCILAKTQPYSIYGPTDRFHRAVHKGISKKVFQTKSSFSHTGFPRNWRSFPGGQGERSSQQQQYSVHLWQVIWLYPAREPLEREQTFSSHSPRITGHSKSYLDFYRNLDEERWVNFTNLDQEFWTPEQRSGKIPPIDDEQSPGELTDQDFDSDTDDEQSAHSNPVIPPNSGPTVRGVKETEIDHSNEDGNHPQDRYSDQDLLRLLQNFGDRSEGTNYNWYDFHPHVPQFFSSLVRSKYLSFFSISFSFTLWFAGTSKSTIWQVLFFMLINTRSGLLAVIKWSVCISKSRGFYESPFSRTDSGLCVYHLVAWGKFNFLHNCQCVTFPIQSCRVLYSLCANLLHSLTIWLTVSTLAVLLCPIYFCFDIVCSYGIVLCCCYERFRFSLEVYSSEPWQGFHMCYFCGLSLEISI